MVESRINTDGKFIES